MALWDKVKGQLRSVIEWEDANPELLFEMWSDQGDEIKNASKLIIKPGQGAIFLYEGKIQAVHLKEGLFDVQSANIPFLTTLSKFMQAFESEHKVAIYFFWQTEFLNQKWGTANPVKYDDPVYKFPVGLRAHGNFSFKITKPDAFFVNVVGSRPSFTINDARRVISERFTQQLADALAEAGFSYAEIDKNRVELATKLTSLVSPDFGTLGFEMTDFRIEGTDFDADTVARIGRIADMSAEAEAARRVGVSYAELQRLQALRDAAKNEGGIAGAGAGLGAGLGMAQAFAQTMGAGVAGGAAIPQAAAAGPDLTTRLAQLKDMLDKSLITAEEFDKKKAEILSQL